ncbi:hypothetical protein GCM10010415_64870 [Streptomyces atrovirens]|uniref:Translationally-controlled tumor protein n=1 Tax=Streptomyces atrovirens TaxID=285556 RepID=A0ABW0DLF0_9ACTN
MLLYSDVLTGDELFSDAFPVKFVDGIVYEVDCPPDEEGDESDNSVVRAFGLKPTTFDKKGYLAYLKGYMKAVKNSLEESGADAAEIAAFEKGASNYTKKIVAALNDYEFYTGSSMRPDGMVCLLNYREDSVTPYFTFWKHGLREQAV